MSEQSQVKQEARTILEELLRGMGFEAKVEALDQAENEVLLHIECAEAAQLIGRKAQVLDALQFVLNRMLYRQGGREIRFVVDVERYRERRKDQVLKDALAAIEEVRRTGQPVRMPPLSAGERRLVHHLVADQGGLESWSEAEAEDGRKQVVIGPVSAPPASPATEQEPVGG